MRELDVNGEATPTTGSERDHAALMLCDIMARGMRVRALERTSSTGKVEETTRPITR